MILTFKVKHQKNFDQSIFDAAIAVAHFALEQGYTSTKNVKHLGLKAEIANQIMRKYAHGKVAQKIKKIRDDRVKLIVPAQNLKIDKENKQITITCLKTKFNFWFDANFTKINQIELDKTWAYVSVTYPDVAVRPVKTFLGVDLNSTSHSIVVADPVTGRVWKLGREIPHLKQKYKAIRSRLQSQQKFKGLKRIKNRERRKSEYALHCATKFIVKLALSLGRGIKLEDLTGIRKNCTKKFNRNGNHTLNSWPFLRTRQLVEQKAKKLGVLCFTIDPAWTSSSCSRCGVVDKESRSGKRFACTSCNHVDHADVNAAFNIASRPKIDRTKKEIRSRGPLKSRSSDDDEGPSTVKPHRLVR